MPYKDLVKKRKRDREYMRKRRANPEIHAKEKKRRKELRLKNAVSQKRRDAEYYQKNREKILARTKNYRKQNPHVTQRANAKVRSTGKSKIRAKADRNELKPHYVAAQIRREGSNKTIEQKQTEILIYRMKKLIKKNE